MSFLRHLNPIEEPKVLRQELPGGLLLLGERVDHVPSLALGAWIRSGSRHERPEETGIAHFIEHMVFRGTRRYSALQIAKRLEAIGGQVDAFTTKEATCYHARIFEGHLGPAVEILGELMSQASFRREMIARERQVVEEEIHSYDDSPEEYVFEVAAEQLWNGHPLGKSILGCKETLQRLGTRDLRRFYRTHYTLPNTVVAAAGRLDFDRLADSLLKNLQLPTTPTVNGDHPLPPFRSGVRHIPKGIHQTSLLLIRRGPSSRDRGRHAQYVLHTALGSGMSSRLYQKVREEAGLAYAIYTYIDSLLDTGMFGVYLGVEPKQVMRALQLVCRELRRVRRYGIRKWEIESAKAQILTSPFLSQESMYERMSRLANNELYHGRSVPLRETVEAIQAVTLEDVLRAAETLLNPRRYSLVTVGPPGQRLPDLEDLDF